MMVTDKPDASGQSGFSELTPLMHGRSLKLLLRITGEYTI